MSHDYAGYIYMCAGSCMASGSRYALGPYSTLDPIRLCNREEKCALTDVVYSTGDFMRQGKNVCKTRSLIN